MRLFCQKNKALFAFFHKTAQWSVLFALFAIPLAYAPWTSSSLGLNKQLVLVLCAIIALIGFVGQIFVQQEIALKRFKLLTLLKVLFLSIFISTLLSVTPWNSFVGISGQEYSSLLSWICFGVIFFVGLHVFYKLRDLWLVIVGLLGIGVVSLAGALLSFIPAFSFAQRIVGSPNTIGVLAAVVCVLSIGILLFQSDITHKKRISFMRLSYSLSIIACILSSIVIYGLDYWLLWLLCALGLGAYVLMLFFQKKHVHYSMIKIFGLVILFSLCLLFFFIPTPSDQWFSAEIAPTYSVGHSIAKESLSHTSWLFGSGPGTFEQSYNLYKPSLVNYSDFWNVSFSQSSSHLLTLVSTIGLLPCMLFGLCILCIAVALVRLIYFSKDTNAQMPVLLLSMVWFLLVLSMCFYSTNASLLSLFWIIGAILLGVGSSIDCKIEIKKTNQFQIAASFSIALLVFSIVFIGYVSQARYRADIAFAQAVAHAQSGHEVEDVIKDLQRAIVLNHQNDAYHRHLAYAYLLQASELIDNTSASPELLEISIASAIHYAQQAVEKNTASVENIAILAQVYQEVSPLVEGADVFAIDAYSQAITLSPTNPMYYAGLAKAYISQADAFEMIASEDASNAQTLTTKRQEALALSVEALLGALSLKPDYTIAQYYLSLAYERQGNLSDAISTLLFLQQENPYDAGLGFQLGLLYLQQGKLDEAQEQFKYVVSLSPKYSNARWFLSSVFEQKGELDLAIEQIEAVLVENPDNELVISRLERLKEGLVIEEDLEPLEQEQVIE